MSLRERERESAGGPARSLVIHGHAILAVVTMTMTMTTTVAVAMAVACRLLMRPRLFPHTRHAAQQAGQLAALHPRVPLVERRPKLRLKRSRQALPAAQMGLRAATCGAVSLVDTVHNFFDDFELCPRHHVQAIAQRRRHCREARAVNEPLRPSVAHEPLREMLQLRDCI